MAEEKYIVFARKYRAQKFDEMVGQEHIVKTLKNAVLTKNIGHAYLFSGPRGVGKTSMARILAKSLNCSEGPTQEPCGRCNSCISITKGSSLDVVEIDGASNRRIDDIRNLIDQLKYPPVEGRDKKKIYIIDEVHMLTNEAFNALLKSLEEPPEYVIFVFATTEPYKVPATILSRCQRFDFRRIPLKKISDKLADIGKLENIDAEPEIYSYIAMHAEGSLRDAEVMLDQINSFSDGRITLQGVEDFLGVISIDWVMKILEKVFQKDIGSSLDLVNKIYYNGLNLKDLLIAVLKVCRDMIILKTLSSDEKVMLYFPEESYGKWQELIKDKDLEIIMTFMRCVQKTYDKVKYSENVNLDIETMLVEMIHLYEAYSIDELISLSEAANIKRKIRGASPAPAETSTAPAAAAADTAASSEAIIDNDNFEAFKSYIRSASPALYADYLDLTFLHSVEGGKLKVFFKDISKLKYKERQAASWVEVEKMASKFFGIKDISITINLGGSSFIDKKGALPGSGLEDDVEANIPEIKTIKEAFSAKVKVKKKENQ